jgi:8-oxo-dGTP diphosphatase
MGMPKIIGPERWVLAVYMLIRNSRGRVLLLRRSQAVGHFPGCWELPGGKPAPGEEIAKTAELEVSEETGLDVDPIGLAGAVEGSVPGLRVAMLILEGRTTDSEVTLSTEHDTYRWVPPGEVSSLKLRPGFDTFLPQYLSQRPRKRSKKSGAVGKRSR